MGREVMRVRPNSPWDFVPEGYKAPSGDWYQMWQTVSDKPYTPAFETPEELARWCADHPWGMEIDSPVPYEAWLRFINGPGWAPSGISFNGAPPVSGVLADSSGSRGD